MYLVIDGLVVGDETVDALKMVEGHRRGAPRGRRSLPVPPHVSPYATVSFLFCALLVRSLRSGLARLVRHLIRRARPLRILYHVFWFL
jgi:hypothetical protein